MIPLKAVYGLRACFKTLSVIIFPFIKGGLRGFSGRIYRKSLLSPFAKGERTDF